jgi:hypothetical protein
MRNLDFKESIFNMIISTINDGFVPYHLVITYKRPYKPATINKLFEDMFSTVYNFYIKKRFMTKKTFRKMFAYLCIERSLEDKKHLHHHAILMIDKDFNNLFINHTDRNFGKYSRKTYNQSNMKLYIPADSDELTDAIDVSFDCIKKYFREPEKIRSTFLRPIYDLSDLQSSTLYVLKDIDPISQEKDNFFQIITRPNLTNENNKDYNKGTSISN